MTYDAGAPAKGRAYLFERPGVRLALYFFKQGDSDEIESDLLLVRNGFELGGGG